MNFGWLIVIRILDLFLNDIGSLLKVGFFDQLRYGYEVLYDEILPIG